MNPRVRYLVTTLGLVAVAVVWNVLDRPVPPPRPARAATPAVVTAPRARPAPPTAAEVLARRAALGLTADQRARLETLASRWAEEAGPLETGVKTASEEFARFMAEAQTAGRVNLDEVRARSVEVQERSATLRARRARHSEQAIGVLTERQRARVADANVNPGGER